MRFVFPNSTAILCVLIALSLLSIGCNSDPGARREVGLLRAEIIDLEDNYALLKSKYERKMAELSSYTGEPVDMTGLPADIYTSDMQLDGQVIVDETIYEGQPTYESNMIFSRGRIYHNPQPNPNEYYNETIVPGTTVYSEGTTVYPNETIIYPNQSISTGEVIDSVPSARPRGTRSPDAIRNQVPPKQPTMAPPGNLPQTAPIDPAERTAPLPLPETISPRGNQGRINSRNPFQLQLESPSATQTGNRSFSRNKLNGDVTEIVINRSGTRGHSVDGIPGDEGINLLIQPKGSRGEILLQPGELTVSIIDPKEPSDNKRLGLWKFLPDESELFFVNDELASHGILLHLPWDQATPTRAKLIIHVRFVTTDGRILQTSSDIRIKPPVSDYSPDDPQIVEWTQQDWRWLSDGEREEFDSNSSQPIIANGYQGSQPFELDFVDGPVTTERDSRWQQSNRNPRAQPSSNESGFRKRVRATPASTRRSQTSSSKDEDEPQWRPVR